MNDPFSDKVKIPQTLQDICHGKNQVGRLIQTAEAMAEFNRQLKNWLDPELVSHCLISHIENGIINLVTDSSAWGTRLRFITPDLLSKIRAQAKWSGIKSIKIRICAETLATLQEPLNFKPEKIASQNLQIPAEAREQLTYLLEQETDGTLKAVLERILNKNQYDQ